MYVHHPNNIYIYIYTHTYKLYLSNVYHNRMPKRKQPAKQEETAKRSKVTLNELGKDLELKVIEELFILAREDRFLNNGTLPQISYHLPSSYFFN